MAEGGRSNGHTQAPAMQTTARILAQNRSEVVWYFRKMEWPSAINLLADRKHAIHNRRCEVVIESPVNRSFLARFFLPHHRL
jgi:ribosomal protein L22